MLQPSTLRERYAAKEPKQVLLLTAVVTFVHGIAIALRFFLREKGSQTLGLSNIEWIAYTVGPFLVSPILLFGLLYYTGTRLDRLPSVSGLVPGLLLAVVAGTFLGQFVGKQRRHRVGLDATRESKRERPLQHRPPVTSLLA